VGSLSLTRARVPQGGLLEGELRLSGRARADGLEAALVEGWDEWVGPSYGDEGDPWGEDEPEGAGEGLEAEGSPREEAPEGADPEPEDDGGDGVGTERGAGDGEGPETEGRPWGEEAPEAVGEGPEAKFGGRALRPGKCPGPRPHRVARDEAARLSPIFAGRDGRLLFSLEVPGDAALSGPGHRWMVEVRDGSGRPIASEPVEVSVSEGVAAVLRSLAAHGLAAEEVSFDGERTTLRLAPRGGLASIGGLDPGRGLEGALARAVLVLSSEEGSLSGTLSAIPRVGAEVARGAPGEAWEAAPLRAEVRFDERRLALDEDHAWSVVEEALEGLGIID
jgi:hypothetical protein